MLSEQDNQTTMEQDEPSSGLWFLPSLPWSTPKQPSKRRTNSLSGLETAKTKPIQRTASSLHLSPLKQEFKKKPVFEIASSAEELEFTAEQPKVGGMVSKQEPFGDEQLQPFEEDLMNQTMEDLTAVGQPVFSDHEEEESITPVQTPLRNSKVLERDCTPTHNSPTTIREPVANDKESALTPLKEEKLVEMLQNQTLEAKGFTPITKVHQEFDPLIPKDWMMSFDSPSVPRSDSIPSFPVVPSLLDSIDPVASPRSIVKYNQRDLDGLRNELQEKHNSEMQLAQVEISELDQKLKALEMENQKMKGVLKDWERAVKGMIQEREKEKQESQLQRHVFQTQLQKSQLEIEALKAEMEQGTIKYKQLRLDYSDLKDINQTLTEKNEKLENDLDMANKRFEALVKHAESKLEEANVEIARVRSVFEKELVQAKSKIGRLEIQNNTLQQSLESKTKENEELMKICDGLEKYFDNK